MRFPLTVDRDHRAGVLLEFALPDNCYSTRGHEGGWHAYSFPVKRMMDVDIHGLHVLSGLLVDCGVCRVSWRSSE